MASFKIETPNLHILTRELGHIFSRQIPFAISVAVNRTAEDAQQAQTDRLFSEFTIRARKTFIGKSVRLKKSTKRQKPPHAILTIRDSFWIQHEAGRLRRPGDVHASIPHRIHPPKQVGRAIKGQNTPAAVLDKQKRTFAVSSRTGRKILIYRRKGKRRLPIILLFTVEPQAQLEPRLKFADTVAKSVRRTYQAHFRRAWTEALRSRF